MKEQFLFNYEPVEPTDGHKYSRKVETPIYTPRNKSNLYECYDDQKYKRLLRLIDQSNVSEQEKKFLSCAASRFIEFNYESIADYYASASQEMQELMEKLALVIIDFGKALEYGFVSLNEKMKKLYELELG